jgi:hypothetical protein
MPPDQHTPRVTADVALEVPCLRPLPDEENEPFHLAVPELPGALPRCGVFLEKVSVSFGICRYFVWINHEPGATRCNGTSRIMAYSEMAIE